MRKDTLYQKIVDYLKGKIASGELKIGDAIYSENLLCERFGVSRTSVRKAVPTKVAIMPTTLTARFTEKFHQTPFQFLKQFRIEHAARLLVESKLSGKEIAGLSGFFSPQHFCTEFQKYYGMTPGNYRRMFKR